MNADISPLSQDRVRVVDLPSYLKHLSIHTKHMKKTVLKT